MTANARHQVTGVLPPLYQRPPGAEIPAMGFSVLLKSLVKAAPPFELRRKALSKISLVPLGRQQLVSFSD
jgi:hypothetical protein